MDENIDKRFYEGQSRDLVNTYEFDKAIVLCKRIIATDPKCYKNHYFWARTRGDQEEYRLSELKFREVIILNPQDFLAFNNLGIALSKQRKYDQAISSYKTGLKWIKDVETINKERHLDLTLNIAIEYTLKGDYEEAIEWYGKALKLNPSDESIQNCMGYLCILQGKFQEAIPKFDDVLQNNPQYEIAYFNKTFALFCQLGVEEKAKEAFEIGIKTLAGAKKEKLYKFKLCENEYDREVDRVGKELERSDLGFEARVHLEEIYKGFKYILSLLRTEIEKLENFIG